MTATLRFNPLSGQLFSENGTLLKTLSCPVSRTRRQLVPDGTGVDLRCATCQTMVLNTRARSVEEIERLVKANPDVCLRVEAGQPNIRVIYEPVQVD